MNPQDKKLSNQFRDEALTTAAVADLNNSIFGMDPVTDKDTPLCTNIKRILQEDINWEAISLIKRYTHQTKSPTIWGRHLPEALSANSKKAVDFVRSNDDFSWERFLTYPEVETALIEDVIYKFLGELAEIRSFVKRERQLVEDWKKETNGGGLYSVAEQQVDQYVNMVFTFKEREHPENKDGLNAFKLVRMAAYRKLAAHMLGSEEFEMSQDLGGVQYIKKSLKSDVIDSIQDKFTQNAMRFVKIGNVTSAKYDVPEKREFRGLLEKIYAECGKSTEGKRFNYDSVIKQIVDSLCPLMALQPYQLDQKQLPVSLAYRLYTLSEGLRVINQSSIYPLLGNGMRLPRSEKLPPDVVERFDIKWRNENMITLGMLAYAGFPVIVHNKLKTMVRTACELVPNMRSDLESSDTIEFLKDARTYKVIVQPIKNAEIQRTFAKLYKESDPKGYEASLLKIKSDTQGLIGTRQQQAEQRSRMFECALAHFRQDPDRSVAYFEQKLLGNKELHLKIADIPNELRW